MSGHGPIERGSSHPVLHAAAEDGGAAVRRVEFDIAPAAILKVLGTLAVLWLAARTFEIMTWIAISLMFVATFNPLVRRLQSRIGRGWAIAILVVGALLLVSAMLGVIIPSLVRQGQSLADNLPQIVERVGGMARGMGMPVSVVPESKQLAARASAMVPQLVNVALVLLSGALGIFTIFILTIYLLIEGPSVGTHLLGLLPRGERLPLRRMFSEIGVEVGAYVRGQLITSSLAGLFAFVFLSLLGVPEPLALAFLMAVSDLIPIVGPLFGTVPAVLLALSQGVPTALAVLVGYIIYLQIEGNLLVPWIYGNTLKLSPFVVLIALLIGATLLGILGALLALPVAAAIPIVARYLSEWHERVEAHPGPVPLPSEHAHPHVPETRAA